MNIETISMDPRIAAIHYKDYRKKVREARAARVATAKKNITDGNKMRRTAYHNLALIEREDLIAMDCYREMVKGARIINAVTALRGAGLDNEKKLPVLALARADWREVRMTFNSGHLCFIGTDNWLNWSSARNRYSEPRKVNHFDRLLFGYDLVNEKWREGLKLPDISRVKAQVPSVPAHLRPSGDLGDYFILFEAKWEKSAPPDPLLLRHIAGHMYSVLAQWDLTPIEKAVLEGRFG